MPNTMIPRVLGPGQTLEVAAVGDYITMRQAARAVRVTVDQMSVTMQAGDTQRFDSKFDRFTLTNLSATKPLYLEMVVGLGDFTTRVITGDLTVRPGVELSDGSIVPDTRAAFSVAAMLEKSFVPVDFALGTNAAMPAFPATHQYNAWFYDRANNWHVFLNNTTHVADIYDTHGELIRSIQLVSTIGTGWGLASTAAYVGENGIWFAVPNSYTGNSVLLIDYAGKITSIPFNVGQGQYGFAYWDGVFYENANAHYVWQTGASPLNLSFVGTDYVVGIQSGIVISANHNTAAISLWDFSGTLIQQVPGFNDPSNYQNHMEAFDKYVVCYVTYYHQLTMDGRQTFSLSASIAVTDQECAFGMLKPVFQQVSANVTIYVNANGDYVATGELIAALIEGRLGWIDSDYLDHVFGFSYTGLDGRKIDITSGTQSFLAADIADDFQAMLPGVFTLTVDRTYQ